MKDNTVTIVVAQVGCVLLASICAIKGEWTYVGMVVVGMLSLAAGHLNGSSTPTETAQALIKDNQALTDRIKTLEGIALQISKLETEITKVRKDTKEAK